MLGEIKNKELGEDEGDKDREALCEQTIVSSLSNFIFLFCQVKNKVYMKVMMMVISLTKSKAKMMAIHFVMIKKSMMAIT